MRKFSFPIKVLLWIVSIAVVLYISYYFASNTSNTSSNTSHPKITKENMASPSNIDVVYYVNLDKRTDRKAELLGELAKIDYPEDRIERISAVYDKDRGHLGCSKSHIQAIEKFIASPHTTCLVLEDDFEFTKSPQETIQSINQLFENQVDFDVCMLSINAYDVKDSEQYPFLQKVNQGLTASGYIVNKHFAPTLLQNFIEGSQKLEQSYIEKNNKDYNGAFAIDQYWCNLQPNNKWYVFKPALGKQRASFSDIQNGNVDYKL